jgi:hypothetical protein
LNKLSQLIKNYADMMERRLLRSHLDAIPARPLVQLDVVLQLIRLRDKTGQSENAFAESVAEFLLGIHKSAATPLEECVGHYRNAYLRYYQPFSHANPGFLENYAINYVFRTRFPFADATDRVERSIDPLYSHLAMVFHYRLLHSLLIGVAAHYRDGFSSVHAVQVVQRFCRAVEHNIGFHDALKVLANAPDFRQTDGLAALLAD